MSKTLVACNPRPKDSREEFALATPIVFFNNPNTFKFPI